MKYHLYIFVFTLYLVLCGCRMADEVQTVEILSWNVQNLFDGIDDGSEYPEFDPGGGKWNQRLYRRRLDRIGSILAEIGRDGPDIIILQEIEKARITDDLAQGQLKNKGYRYRLAVPGYGIIRSAVLSRYPVFDVQVVECGFWGERSLRPLLIFSLQLPDEAIRVIAVHWKSPRGGRKWTEKARYREALITRNRVEDLLKLDHKQKILIIGDLNTEGKGLHPPSALAPLGRSDAALYRSSEREFPEDEDKLVFFDPEPTSGPPGTYFYKSKWERPDRALLSAAFLEGDGWIYNDCRIPDNPELLNAFGEPNRWKTYKEEGYSDHLPLLLELSRYN